MPESQQELFDGATRTTYNVQITGKTVVFDNSSPLYGGLYTRFHNRADLKRVMIDAENVVDRNALRLPGTEITKSHGICNRRDNARRTC